MITMATSSPSRSVRAAIAVAASALPLLVGCLAGAGDDGVVPSPCGDRLSCAGAVVGDTCATTSERCTCAIGSGMYWRCEPLACPLVDGSDGAGCPAAGLRCDAGFEEPGALCVGPELVWAACRYYHRAGGVPPSGCPSSPPTLGGPCCQGLPPGGPPSGCAYGAEIYDCVGDHWLATAP